MHQQLERVLKRVRALPEASQSEVTEALLASLDQQSPDVHLSPREIAKPERDAADREGIWNWGEGVVCDERTWTQTARGRTATRRPARSQSQGPRRSKPRHSDGTADSTQARWRRHATS